MASDPEIRTLIRTRTRTRRRSACHRHPNESVTGFCALCLRDRLAGLESAAGELELEHDNNVASSSSCRRIRGHAGASSSGAVPELRRSKSVAAEKCEVLNGFSLDLRRRSCDVKTRSTSTLSDLFDIDDTKGGGDGIVKVESKNLGFSRLVEPVLETNEDDDDCDDIRVSDDLFVRNEVHEVDDDDAIGEVEDLKTMKEYIDIELQNKKKKFWESASVFSQKLRKWRQKQKNKKQNGGFNGGTDDNNRSNLGQLKDHQSEVADYRLGRRSCDTEPRFSIDANRISVEDPRFSYDEHRASWDGYMIARTIPRLTPMLPIVDDMMFPPVNNGVAVDNQQMHPILENGPSSSGSAGSTQSNSDTSSSNTGSSSSSMKSSSSNSKTAGLEGDYTKSVSKSIANDVISQETKLVITEKELEDWRLSSEFVSNAPISVHTTINYPNGHKKAMTSRWRKVCNLWGYKYDKKNEDHHTPENGSFVGRVDGVERGNSSANLVRNSSVSSRNRTELHPSSEFVLDRNRSSRHSMSDLDSGLLRLYLSPFRKSRGSKI